MSQMKLLLLSTGGTIAGNVAKNAGVEDKKTKEAGDFKETVSQALNYIKENWAIDVHIDAIDICDVDSSNMNPEIWSDLINTIHKEYDNYDAFLVAHGTNTMGYTAAALSFALENTNKPIIITGAQVPLGRPGSDALMNLDNALRIAAWPYHQIRGVIAVFGSHIISGTRVKKSTDFDYDAFRSFSTASLGQIGRVINIKEGHLEKHNSYLSKNSSIALRASGLNVRANFDMRIASLTEFPGMSPDLFQSLVENNDIKGFVFRAYGAGDASSNLHGAFEYLKEKEIPIIITTQCPNGNSNFQVNQMGQDLKKKGLALPAFDMSIESMTVKMGWLIGQGLSYEQIKNMMQKDLHGEINITNDMN